MNRKNSRLYAMMFFQLAVPGTYAPILSIYFTEYIGLNGIQTGVILSMAAIPSILSPFISAWVVDRIITSRRFLMLSHLIAALLIITLSYEKSYNQVFITYLLYVIFQMPTTALVTTVIFHYIEDRKSFGLFRLSGTFGWVAAGWIVSFIWKFMGGIDNLPIALRISAFFAFIVIALAFELPKLELNRDKTVTIIPKETIEVLKKPEIILILFLILVSSTADRFLIYGMPIFLKMNGIAQDNILMILSIGQISEVFILLGLSKIIKKTGFKISFIIGMFFQLLRFSLFYITGRTGILAFTIAGISVHGLIYALFYINSSIYIDYFSDEKSRGGLHQIYTLTLIGVSSLIGNLLAGFVAERFSVDGTINFEIFWMFPIIMSVITFITLLFKLNKVTNH